MRPFLSVSTVVLFAFPSSLQRCVSAKLSLECLTWCLELSEQLILSVVHQCDEELVEYEDHANRSVVGCTL